jgi:transposase
LSHKPGHAQVDFGEADGIIDGKLVRFHYFCMDLPHSDAPFIKAYPAEVAEAFCEGHVAAFAFFGGVPQSILYDNTKLAVAQILGDGTASAQPDVRHAAKPLPVCATSLAVQRQTT